MQKIRVERRRPSIIHATIIPAISSSQRAGSIISLLGERGL
jgi:hypothetical protein